MKSIKRAHALTLLLALCALAGHAVLAAPHAMPNPRPSTDPWMGKQKALVLLLEWKNEPHQVSVEEVQKTFFGTAPGDFSMRQYFWEGSGGKYDFNGTVVPWKMTKKKWSRLTCIWGEPVDSWLDDLKGCSPNRVVDIAWEAHKAGINIADYDADGDGKIDHLFIVHSGRIWKNRVGPDRVFSFGSKIANEAVVFQSQGLGAIGKEIPIGFYIHESGHNNFYLGDYYGIDYKKGQYGIGMWGIMGLGAWGESARMPVDELFRHPAHYEAASMVRNGWANAQVFTVSTKHVRLRPVETSADVAIVPMGSYQSQSYFLEYRSNQGFSAALPGHGLLIWHGWELMQADGRDDLNHGHMLGHRPLPPNEENFGDASDPFPGSLGVTSFQDAKTGLRFENIVQTDDAVEFDIVFPSSDLEAQSDHAVESSLRTYSSSFQPVSLNGVPWGLLN